MTSIIASLNSASLESFFGLKKHNAPSLFRGAIRYPNAKRSYSCKNTIAFVVLIRNELFPHHVMLHASRFVGNARFGAFDGDRGFVAAHGFAVFEALGACGVVLSAHGAHGARALDYGFGQGEQGKCRWENFSAEIRVKTGDKNSFSAAHRVMQQRNDLRRKKLRLVDADDVILLDAVLKSSRIRRGNGHAVERKSGSRLHRGATRVCGRPDADRRDALLRIDLQMPHQLQRLSAHHGAGEEGERSDHSGNIVAERREDDKENPLGRGLMWKTRKNQGITGI